MYTEQIQINKTNKLAGLHPVTKLIIVLLYSVTSGVLGSITSIFDGYAVLMYAWFLVIPILAFLSGIGKKFMKAFVKVFTIAFIILIVQALIVETRDVGVPGVALLRWNISEKFHPTVWKYGLQNGLKLGFNVLNIGSAFVWLFQCTKNKELSRGLEDVGLNYKVVYVFLSSLQMIGVLGAKSQTIMNAQRARGVETEGNLLVRAKAFFPTMVPLVLSSITDTEERVLTMESKGFDAPCEKTHLLNINKSGIEKLCTAVFGALLVAAIAGRILLWVL